MSKARVKECLVCGGTHADLYATQRAPTFKALTATFRDLSPEHARLIRALIKATDDGEALRDLIEGTEALGETAQYVRSLYSSPYGSACWRVTVVMHAINQLIRGFGVEPLGEPEDRAPYAPPYEYVNMGDTYASTILYSRASGGYWIGDWGTVAERL